MSLEIFSLIEPAQLQEWCSQISFKWLCLMFRDFVKVTLLRLTL